MTGVPIPAPFHDTGDHKAFIFASLRQIPQTNSSPLSLGEWRSWNRRHTAVFRCSCHLPWLSFSFGSVVVWVNFRVLLASLTIQLGWEDHVELAILSLSSLWAHCGFGLVQMGFFPPKVWTLKVSWARAFCFLVLLLRLTDVGLRKTEFILHFSSSSDAHKSFPKRPPQCARELGWGLCWSLQLDYGHMFFWQLCHWPVSLLSLSLPLNRDHAVLVEAKEL